MWGYKTEKGEISKQRVFICLLTWALLIPTTQVSRCHIKTLFLLSVSPPPPLTVTPGVSLALMNGGLLTSSHQSRSRSRSRSLTSSLMSPSPSPPPKSRSLTMTHQRISRSREKDPRISRSRSQSEEKAMSASLVSEERLTTTPSLVRLLSTRDIHFPHLQPILVL